MAYQEIIYEVSEQIATITLNRPEKLNAFTNRMLKEIISAFDESDADDNVRAVIVTGAGRAFVQVPTYQVVERLSLKVAAMSKPNRE